MWEDVALRVPSERPRAGHQRQRGGGQERVARRRPLSLVTKLAQFYADRTLTKSPITPADQAEAYFLLVSQRLSKTTGQVITVDGGLHEAFLR